MRLSRSSSRTMSSLLSWVRLDVALPYLLFLLAASMIVGGMVVQLRFADQKSDATTTRLAAAAAQDIAGALEQFDRTLQAMIARQQAPELQSQDVRARNSPLFERIQREPYFAFIDVLDQKGNSLAGLPQDSNNWSNQDYFRALQYSHLDKLYIGGRFSVDNERNVGFTISRRMIDSGGNFAGVVVMGVRLAYFRDLLQHLELGLNDSAMLLREDGIVLMRLPFDMNNIGDTLNPTTAFYTAMRAGVPSVTAPDPIDRVERRFVFRHVGTLPLVVSVGVATDESNANWWLAVAGAAAVAAVGLVTRLLWREIRRRDAIELESGEKSRFLTMLSHELRTPLHSVLGYADQLLRHDEHGPARSRQLAEIVRAAKHMRDVVNVVLDYARIEALGPVPHMRRVDVRSLVQDCLAVIEPGARARGLETRIVAATGAPTHFVTDDTQLRQILVNLMSNAVKYTPRGSIELRLLGDADHLTIEVADTGIGIPEAQRHRLFKEYERFGAERTSIEGTGLGLAIAQRLADRLGGHMGHRNNPGGGSVFWLQLPAGVAEEPATVAEPEEIEPDRRLNVLVVDDSEVNRKVATAYLRKAGHAAIEAHDGVDAVRLVAALEFDVVLMDMRMPGMDGLEATRRIRALDGPRAQVPIVAVTANALDQHAEECRRTGMSQHLAKPFTQAELIAVVKRATAHQAHASCDAPQTIDLDSIAELALCMDPDAIHGLLDSLSQRIEALLRRLDEPTPFAAPQTLADLAHELAGGAGTLGFSRLSMIAARFQTAIVVDATEAGRMVAEMRREAEAALVALRHRRALEGLTPA
jgi:signal transduction histidine kinase/CheY-like chemotaxis protein/HPt (histidine-containing phosphotransfer) domain-containing protein